MRTGQADGFGLNYEQSDRRHFTSALPPTPDVPGGGADGRLVTHSGSRNLQATTRDEGSIEIFRKTARGTSDLSVKETYLPLRQPSADQPIDEPSQVLVFLEREPMRFRRSVLAPNVLTIGFEGGPPPQPCGH